MITFKLISRWINHGQKVVGPGIVLNYMESLQDGEHDATLYYLERNRHHVQQLCFLTLEISKSRYQSVSFFFFSLINPCKEKEVLFVYYNGEKKNWYNFAVRLRLANTVNGWKRKALRANSKNKVLKNFHLKATFRWLLENEAVLTVLILFVNCLVIFWWKEIYKMDYNSYFGIISLNL